MSWVYLALMGTAALAIVNIFDSHLLSKRLPSVRALLLPAGIIFLIVAVIMPLIFPPPENISISIILIAIIPGILRGVAVIIMLYAFKSEEVSRVVPVVSTYPIFVAIMAALFLGENLGYLQWLAIIIVVAGAVIISARQSPSGTATWKIKPMLFLFGSSLLIASADIISKYVLGYISPLNLIWLNTSCIAVIFLLASLRPHVIRQLGSLKGRRAIFGFIASYETLAFAGMLMFITAIERGPVSLVSTVMASRPAFVVVIALILSRVAPSFLEWHPGRGMLALRLIATAMIVGGIVIINLV